MFYLFSDKRVTGTGTPSQCAQKQSDRGKKGRVPALLNESSGVSLSRRLCFQPKHTHVPKPSGEPQEETRSVIPASADRELHAWFSLGFLAGNFTDNVVHKSIIRPLLSLSSL